jgi:predicted GH43/DUF377 family glycosyl hydrolase
MPSFQKLGLVFKASGQRPWMQTHTALPVACGIGTKRRILFGTRDKQQRASVGWVDLDLQDPGKILDLATEPALSPGEPGHFDDGGVYPGSIVEVKAGELWMYYCGRNNGERPLYYMAIGLAVSKDGGQTFKRFSKAPILGRHDSDPWMVSTPCVLREGDLWRMWYLSGLGWTKEPNWKSFYHIKYAESRDGVSWERPNLVCIPLADGETNIASPAVVKTKEGTYNMWYSYVAGNGYRIGFATSNDGRLWTRNDAESGLELSATGWDSEAMAYPSAFEHAGKNYLLYSGNNLGIEGFGLAVSR